MILLYERLENGDCQVTGFDDLRGMGKSSGEALEDFLRKLKDLSDEHKREHGYGLFYSAC